MKFKLKLLIGISVIILIGVVGILFFVPKVATSKSGISFKTDENINAKVTGSVSGSANVVTFNELTYSNGTSPTDEDVSSWETNLEFGEGDEITITITVNNYNNEPLYVFLVDNGEEISNVTKTIYNNGEEYTSGKIVFLQAGNEEEKETIFTVKFRKEHDVSTNIKYRYEVRLRNNPEAESGLVTTTDLIFKYNQDNGTAVITGLSTTSTDTELTIPMQVIKDGRTYTIIGIDQNAFKNNTRLTKVEVPYTIKSLGNSAFEGCSNLASINIPETVTTLGNKLFQKCTSLTKISIPDSVTTAGTNLFTECTKLNKVTIGKGLTTLGGYMFSKCSSLTSLTIPQTITTFGSNLFQDCANLTSVNIPTGVTELPSRLFSGCKKLILPELPAGLTTLGNYVFAGCDAITTLTLPSTITTAGSNALAGLNNIEEITIPCSLTNMNSLVLDSVLSAKISVIPGTENKIVGKLFKGTNIQSIILCEGITEIVENAFSRCESLTTIEIQNGLTTIGAYAFNRCTSLTSIKIPDSIETIGYNAFEGCGNLTTNSDIDVNYLGNTNNPYVVLYSLTNKEITQYEIKDHCRVIYQNAFSRCGELVSVSLPNSLTDIGYGAFSNCSSLQEIVIPSSVITVGSCAFDFCNGLQKVTTPTLEGWLKISFGEYRSNPLCYTGELYIGENKITEIVIPNNTTKINSYVFSGLTNIDKVVVSSLEAWLNINFATYESNPLSVANHFYVGNQEITELVIPNSVTEIKNYAFYNCKCITGLLIPKSVTGIGEGAFYGCDELTEVTFENNSSLKSIGNFVFSGCSKITSFEVPNGVTSIGSRALSHCGELVNITIPNSVTEIGDAAFDGCLKLTNVMISSLESWVSISFEIQTCDRANPLYYATHIFLNGIELINDIRMPEVTEIKPYVFANYMGEFNLIIPSSVKTIGQAAFEYCSNMLSVTFEGDSQLETIGGYAFSNCRSLTSFTIPKHVTEIGSYAFTGCYMLTEIYNLSDLKVNKHNLYNCGAVAYYAEDIYTDKNTESKLSTIEGIIYYKENENSYYVVGLADKSITQVELNSNTTKIRECAFYYCSGLTSVTIPSSVTSIGDDAFRGCSGLTRVVTSSIEDWLKISFGGVCANPLYYAHHLYIGEEEVTELTIPNTITEIKARAFYGCTGLTSVTIPSNITSIGSSAFDSCSGLTSVTIPSSVTSIGNNAFSGCSGLTSIYIPSTVTTISASSYSYSPFYGCSSTLTIYTDVADASSKPSGWQTYWNNYARYNKVKVTWDKGLEDYLALLND